MRKLTLLLIVIVALLACSCNSKAPLMKNVTGNAGEIVVVINTEIQKTEAGTAVKEILGQPQLGLPQSEPLLDVITISHEAFGDIFKTARNILITNVEPQISETKLTFQHNLHAHTQAVVTVSAKNSIELAKEIRDNADKIAGFFLKAERDRIILNYTNFNEKSVSEKTDKLFGFRLSIPPGYKIVEASENFAWIRHETPDISQGLLIYTFPYESDSTFTKKYLLAKRNIVLKNNVPGPLPETYMTTEAVEYPIFLNVRKFKGNYAAEMRGIWRVENDFMAGPFVSLFVLDILKKRVVAIDGYVYAPGKNKRNYLRQVEGIIYSTVFTEQADMDKLNTQLLFDID